MNNDPKGAAILEGQMKRHAVAFLLTIGALAHVENARANQESHLKAPVPAANAALLEHQERFSEPEIIKVQSNIYVAHGFDMCNIIFVEGPDGVIVMDTGFRVDNAKRAITAFREISDKPIKAVFYSHGHADHVGGAEAFKDEAPTAAFIAHEGWRRNINHVSSAVRPTFSIRALAQLGLMLPEGLAGTVGSGGGPVLRPQGRISYVPPTRTVADGEWLELAGLKFQALHTPGDLDDGLSLWFPKNKTVLTGDTVTDSHVHVILSTPRHEPGRDAQAFVDSMSRIEALNARVLIGGHGDVVEGKNAVRDLVREDRRSAQFIIDEVVRNIRRNRSGDHVQATLAYPDWFLEEEDRGDYYHKLSWISRGVYTQYMGWFTGDAVSLSPIAPRTRAARIVEGFGGAEAALAKLRQAYAAEDFAWTMELATLILAVDPANAEARQLKSWSMKSIAYASESANERNYLLTQAMLLDGKIKPAMLAQASARAGLPASYQAADATEFLHTLGARLNVDAARDTEIAFKVELSDRDETYFVEIDKGVLLTSPSKPKRVDFTISLNHRNLAILCEGYATFADLQAADSLQVTGSQNRFRELTGLF